MSQSPSTLHQQRNDDSFESLWDELVWRGLVHVSTDDAALRDLLAGPPIVYYCGFDPIVIGFGVLNLMGPWVISIVARVQVKRAKTAARLIAARTTLEAPKVAWRQVSGLAMTSFVAVVGGTGVSFLISDGGPSEELVLYTDVRTGIVITLVASFLMVACSVGVNQASAVLDRRDLYVGLDRIGMPRSVQESARARAILVPLCWVSLGSALLGGVLVFPLAGYALVMAPMSVAVIAISFAAGIGLVALALLATRPVVTSVLRRPERA